MKNLPKTSNCFLLILSTALFAACGKDNPLERPTKTSGSLSSESATSFGESFGNSLGQYSETAIDGGEAISQTSSVLDGDTKNNKVSKKQLFSSAIKTSAASSCEPTITGDTTDADGDSIPVNQTTVADCSVSLLGTSINLSGQISAQDKADTDKFGGYIFSMTDFNITFGSSEITFNLYAEGTNSSGKHNGRFDFVTSSTRDGVTLKSGLFIDSVVTPTDADDPQSTGVIDSLSGFISLNGTYESTAYDVVTSVSGTDLTYDTATCTDKKIKNGTVTFTDGASNRLEVIYTDCAVTYEYNDTVVTPTRDIK